MSPHPNLLHLLPGGGNNRNEFGVGAGTSSNMSQLLPGGGNNRNEFGVRWPD